MFIKNNHHNINNITTLSINKPNTSKQKGFTLIELLVVIAVIAILSTILMIGYTDVRAQARDATRAVHLNQLEKLLEMAKLTEGSYLESDPETFQIKNHDWGSLWEGYGTIPKDPLSGQSYAYVSDGETYQLYAKFEREPINNRFACGGSCGPEGYYNYNAGIASLGSQLALGEGEEPSGGEEPEEGWPETPPLAPPEEFNSIADARDWAQGYCDTYFKNTTGTSTLNGQVIYCDSYNNMWAPTLDDTYAWANDSYKYIDITSYTFDGSSDCNKITLVSIENFPACNACATLNYAGFPAGSWRLPSHSDDDSSDCCCHWSSQLWLYGHELCQNRGWGINCDGAFSCQPTWEEDKAKASSYWSAIQSNYAGAWIINFNYALANGDVRKTYSYHVRCFLGH